MYSEEATAEVPQLKLPADLVAEVRRYGKSGPSDFRVDGWKPTLLERLAQMLGLA
jgi:hypothetical protein